MYLLQRDSQFLNGHDLFLKRVGASYHAFIEEAEKVCRGKCQEDLQSTTRYVTWSLHTKSRSSLKAMLSKVRLLPLTSQMLKSCITFACTASPKSTFGHAVTQCMTWEAASAPYTPAHMQTLSVQHCCLPYISNSFFFSF